MNPDYATRIMIEMASHRASIGLLEGKPMPIEQRDVVLNRMYELFVAEALASAKKRPKKVSDLTDSDWLESLEHEPALKGINIKQELGRAQLWAKQNKRVATRRFLMNWFMRQERVVDLKAMGATHATGLKLPAPSGPNGWREWLKTELDLLSPEHGAYSQLRAAFLNNSYTMLPKSWAEKCQQQLPKSA